MGKRKHRDPAERAARARRREARSAVSRARHQSLDAEVNNLEVGLTAEGVVGKHAHVTGTPSPVTPPDENEEHDSTPTTG